MITGSLGRDVREVILRVPREHPGVLVRWDEYLLRENLAEWSSERSVNTEDIRFPPNAGSYHTPSPGERSSGSVANLTSAAPGPKLGELPLVSLLLCVVGLVGVRRFLENSTACHKSMPSFTSSEVPLVEMDGLFARRFVDAMI
jgi:hypothetical protein